VTFPEIGLERTIDFGSIRVGEVGTQTMTVSNRGTADLTIADIALTGPRQDQYRRPVDKDSCSGTILPPERSCTVLVRLKPMQPGPLNATLEIVSNDPNQRVVNVMLNGTGTP
jgi:Abnormal spindle-like microcephaly-assoc'd, ASPM-SPD-2-Hydin